jgi:hypothetical protein
LEEKKVIKEWKTYAKIFERARIVTYKGTDIEKRLARFLENGSFSHLSIVGASDDDGLKLILNGDVDIFFGGAIQAEYARHSFPSRVRPFFKTSSELSNSTILYFWAPSNSEYRPLLTMLTDLWNRVFRTAWEYISQKSLAPETRSWVHKFREFLLVALNRDFVNNTVQGFVESFEDLAGIINSHNTLSPKMVAEAKDPSLGPVSRETQPKSNGHEFRDN